MLSYINTLPYALQLMCYPDLDSMHVPSTFFSRVMMKVMQW